MAEPIQQTMPLNAERFIRPQPRRKLADLAYDALRSSITTGEFAMGERLVETQIAKDLDMSRAPVREALRRLLEEGLVVERPHHGMVVRIFGGPELVDLYSARVAIETTALRLFVRRGSSPDALRAQIERRRIAALEGNAAGVVAADFAFHDEVFRGSANAILHELFRKIEAQTVMALALADAGLDVAVDEHVPVVEALERGDEDGAVDAFNRLVVATVERLTARLGGDPHELVCATMTAATDPAS